MDEEKAAVLRLQQGDIAGLEQLVHAYYFPAVRAAYLILRDRDQAEDVVQGTFLDLPAKIRQYDPGRPFRAWFMRCVVNAALNAVRVNRRQISLESFDETQTLQTVQSFVTQQVSPEASAEARELSEAVWQALEMLTHNQRAAIVMRYYLGLSQAEMVAELDSPASSIKWWLHSARQRLRELLAPMQSRANHPADRPDTHQGPG